METINITNELQFKTSRSGGNGGQNVNKTETKVEVVFYISQSQILTESQKELLLTKYANKINSQGALSCYSQATRSQLSNKEIAIKQINALINKAFVKKKMRKPTRVPKAIKEKILSNKKLKGQTKQLRQKVRL
jgi:ribosome-associated protein